MDNKTVFVKTSKGEEETHSKTPHLVGDVRRALLMVDGTATFGEISKRAAPSLRSMLDEMFRELEKGGLIQDKAKQAGPSKMVVPPRVSAALKVPAKDAGEELDFTAAFRAPSPAVLAAEAGKAEAERQRVAAEAKARAEAEARQASEAAQLKLQQEVAKAKAEGEAKARALAEAKAQQEAAKAKAEAEAKAQQEAVRVKAEAEARLRAEMERRAKAEADAARQKAEQEAAQVRAELAAAKAKAEAEAKAREEAERRAKAEAARLKAEQQAAQVRAELEAAKAKAEAEAARAAAEQRAKAEAEAARLKAEQQAEEARRKAEQEAAKLREEAEQRVKREVEAARIKAEQEAQSRAAAEQKARREAELARAEAEAKQAAEVARLKAESTAAAARKQDELAKQKALEESQAQEASEQSAKEQLDKSRRGAERRVKPDTVQSARSTSATVLFFDVVGYTKQSVQKQIVIKKQFNQLVSECLRTLDDGDQIILDTGDGAAIGFLQHPEDALEVALQFRKAVMANQHQDYPDLKVRIGIHLGPVNVVKDMNGQSNMVGDGINDAQRVMSFAGIDQVYISRAYYDFVSRLSDEYAALFQYRGAQKDKHEREHQVYELVDAAAPVAQTAESPVVALESAAIKLEPFNFVLPDAQAKPDRQRQETRQEQGDEALFRDMDKFSAAELQKMPPVVAVPEQKQAEQKQPEQKQAEQAAPPVAQEVTAAAQQPAKVEASVKPVPGAHMPSAEEVSTLAAAQAKAWAEAEQRALQASQTKAERDAQPQPKETREIPVTRVRRKPVPWGKMAGGLFLLALIALFVVPLVMPMQDYAGRIEKSLGARLQQPVHIGQMSGRLLPAPRLVLSNVTVGAEKQVQAAQAQLNFAFSALFSDTKAINSVELQGLQVNGAALQAVADWLQQTAADAQYPIARIQLNQGKVEAQGISFADVGGTLDFDPAGKFTQAKLHSNANKFALDINSAVENKLQFSLMTRTGPLPLLPNWNFDELNAKGELNKDGMQISDFDARIAGGILLGDARIDWRSGWQVQGKLVAKTITLQNVNRLLEGDMDGSARFQMKSSSLADITDTATLDGNFVVKKGMLGGMDIVETARLRSRESMPGGRTHYDELSGELSYANGAYHFKQLKVRAGVLNATGAVDIVKQQLSGHVNAELTMRTGMGTVALQVGGTTETPTLRTAR